MNDFLYIVSVIRLWVYTAELAVYMWHSLMLLPSKSALSKRFGIFFLLTTPVSIAPILFSLNGSTGIPILFDIAVHSAWIGALLSGLMLLHIIKCLQHLDTVH